MQRPPAAAGSPTPPGRPLCWPPVPRVPDPRRLLLILAGVYAVWLLFLAALSVFT